MKDVDLDLDLDLDLDRGTQTVRQGKGDKIVSPRKLTQ